MSYTKQSFGNDRSTWLENRGIGGSSASAILGKNPWMSKMDIYNAIVLGRKAKDGKISTESTTYGNRCEDLIRKLVAINFEGAYKVIPPNGFEMYHRDDKPYMTATLDGTLVDEKTGAKGVLEIKTHDVKGARDLEMWNGRLPDNYFIQVIHYLAVMDDYQFAILVAKLRFNEYGEGGKKVSREEIRYYRMDRSDPTIQRNIAFLEKALTEFWENNVEKRVIPSIEISI